MNSREISRVRWVAYLEDAGNGTAVAELAQSTARKTEANTFLKENMAEQGFGMLVREQNAVVREYGRVTETVESLSERGRERSRLENLGIASPTFYTSERKTQWGSRVRPSPTLRHQAMANPKPREVGSIRTQGFCAALIAPGRTRSNLAVTRALQSTLQCDNDLVECCSACNSEIGTSAHTGRIHLPSPADIVSGGSAYVSRSGNPSPKFCRSGKHQKVVAHQTPRPPSSTSTGRSRVGFGVER